MMGGTWRERETDREGERERAGGGGTNRHVDLVALRLQERARLVRVRVLEGKVGASRRKGLSRRGKPPK